MVRDTFAASSPSVTINIAPLLSLSADQHSKFMQKRRTPQVFSLHLDAYRTTSQQKEICALLLRVASHGSNSTSVAVFSSAQALTNNPIYRSMLHSLLNMKLVLVVCIDEVHLFVQCGLWFHSEFVRLKSVLFDHLRRGADSDKTDRDHLK
jgi:superfamily II DNA helicase RecQ